MLLGAYLFNKNYFSMKGLNRFIYANNIRLLREKENKSRQEVADELGISVKRYSNWEDGVAYPKMSMLIKVCKYYGYFDLYHLIVTPF